MPLAPIRVPIASSSTVAGSSSDRNATDSTKARAKHTGAAQTSYSRTNHVTPETRCSKSIVRLAVATGKWVGTSVA